MRQVALIAISFLLLSGACKKSRPADPYFGNGVHNVWADQNSIVIWTRLTEAPDMNRSGPEFLVPSAQQHRRLDKQANPDSIYAAQIPEGFTINQLEGACPGMPGEVRLVCYPLRNPEERTEIDWKPVDNDKNYTTQWKLGGLHPGTKYIVELEARRSGKREISATVSGAFRTPPDPDSVRAVNFCIVTCHDYPRRDDSNWLKHTLTWMENGIIPLGYKPVIITKYQPKEHVY